MMYLEWLRARRALVWYVAAVVVCALFAIGSALIGINSHATVDSNGHVSTFGGLSSLGTIRIPVEAFLAGGFLGAIAVALALGGAFTSGSLNRETGYANFTFVLPVTRLRQALAIVAVDVVAIAIGYVVLCAVAIASVKIVMGSHVAFSSIGHVPFTIVASLGNGLLWYAMLQAATAWYPGKAGNFGLALGIAFLFAPALTHLPGIAPLAHAFLYIDPLSYLPSITSGASASNATASMESTMLGMPFSTSVGVEWALVLAALAFAIGSWNRVEAGA